MFKCGASIRYHSKCCMGPNEQRDELVVESRTVTALTMHVDPIGVSTIIGLMTLCMPCHMHCHASCGVFSPGDVRR